jgi:hypothetical protein
MWARLVVAPWWVLWLVSAAVFAAWLCAICALGLPGFGAGGWMWPLVSIVGFSLIATALLTVAQRPMQQSYAPAIAGLSLPQRSQVAKALRRGEVPADPGVLAAAIRVGSLLLAYRRRVPLWQKRLRWIVPALWIIAGILGFIGNNIPTGVAWVGLALLVAMQLVRTSYKERRLSRRLELLRSAVDANPQALSALALADAEDSPAPPPRLRIRVALLVVVVVAVAAAVALTMLRDRRTPECRTADSVVGFIHAHPDMLDSTLITPDGPGLDKYQQWSTQLQAYSRQVPGGDLAPHLHRIAELSAQAVAIVGEARGEPAASQSIDDMLARKTGYRNIIGQLIDEDKALIPICHPRSAIR